MVKKEVYKSLKVSMGIVVLPIISRRNNTPIVKTITMYKDQLCSRCGFKILKGQKGYSVEDKLIC